MEQPMSQYLAVQPSNEGWLRSPSWARKLSANLSDLITPLRSGSTSPVPSAVGNLQSTQRRTRIQRPVSWHPSTTSAAADASDLVFPQLDLPETNPEPLLRQNSLGQQNYHCRKPLPAGEHSAAARSRIRNRSHSRTRRSKLNPTQSLRSSRRHSSASQAQVTIVVQDACDVQGPVPQILSPEQIRAKKAKNRQSAPLLRLGQVSSSEDLQRLKYLNRLSAPLPLLGPIPASPDSPIFQADHLRFVKQGRQSRLRRSARIIDGQSISPKSLYSKPALLELPTKSPLLPPRLVAIPASRKKRDVSHVPVSAKKMMWSFFIDQKAPIIITTLNVVRRPSGVTGWSLDTPTPRMPLMQSQKVKRHSLEWSAEYYGRRQYYRDTGHW